MEDFSIEISSDGSMDLDFLSFNAFCQIKCCMYIYQYVQGVLLFSRVLTAP